MKKEILKKHLKLIQEPKEYYFYAKDKIEIISKQELEKKMEIFSKKNRLQLLEESKKANQTKPTYSQMEGSLGAREDEFVVLQTAQMIQRYSFANLVGVMPIEFSLIYLSCRDKSGVFGVDRLHSYEKQFKAINEKEYQLNLPDGRFFLFEKESNRVFKDIGSFGVEIKEFFVGFKKSYFTLQYPTGVVETYKDEKLTKIEDSNANSITLEYENSKNLKRIENSSGSGFDFYYSNGLISQIKDQSQRVWSFNYDKDDYLTEIYLENRLEESYDYNNPNHYLSTISNTLDQIINTFSYNQEKELQSYTQAKEKIEYIWHQKSQIEKIDSQQQSTLYALDNQGLISHITYTDKTTTSTLWDEKRLESIKNTRGGNQRIETFDKKGRLLSVTLNEKEEERYSYDESNPNPLSLITPQENILYSYDKNYNLTTISYEDGTSKYYSYTTQGQIDKVIDAKDNITSYTYNHQGEISEVVDANGAKRSFKYDNLGRVVESISATEEKERFSYNKHDQIVKVTNSLDESIEFSYTETKSLKSIKDPSSKVTRYYYDEYNRVIQKEYPRVYNIKHSKTESDSEYYSYNTNNTLSKIVRVDGTQTRIYL